MTSHVLTPLRVLHAVAPSGAEIRFHKFSESAAELSWWQGCLSAAEDAQFWKAKLRAEKGGQENWDKARAILENAGWRVTDE
jgi:hypothetical protein